MNDLWKPDGKTIYYLNSFNKKQAAKKRKKKTRKQLKAEAREELIKHFGMHKYATNMAICYKIQQEAGWRLPLTDAKASKMVGGYYKKLKSVERIRRKPRKSDKDFYSSLKWRELRYIALSNSGGTCSLCGATQKDGVQLHVDHIKPRSKYPELEHDLDNLQILCQDCKLGKSNFDEKDWRQYPK